jgi:ubiquinone/menaquinone biosynthesis C-methylase UbiE
MIENSKKANLIQFEEQMHSQTELPGKLIFFDDLHYISHRYRYVLDLADKKDILEIGAGSRIGKKEISTLSKSYIGLDISKKNISRCLPLEKEFGIKFIWGDAHNIPFADNSFNLIIALAMIYYLDIDNFLNEAKRILRPNGKLFFCTSNKCVKGFVPAPYTTKYYTVPELDEILNNHGFTGRFKGAFEQKSSLLRSILIFIKNSIKFIFFTFRLKGYWPMMRNFYKGTKVTIPEELSDFPEFEVLTTPIDPNVKDSRNRIIYCESELKVSN